jgi:CRP-like cAMP-binding protein
MRLERAEPGQVLGWEGEDGNDFWLILEGRLEITARAASGSRHLAETGPGSIIGELALLRHRPRTATVTALEPCRYLCGEADAMTLLLEIPTVRQRIRRLASRRLAEDVRPVRTQLRDGTGILLRPLLPSDRDAVDSALHRLSQQSIRRRFFSPALPSGRLLDYLVDIDYVDHFAWAAQEADTHEGAAVARYIRHGADSAEMAFTIVDRLQGRGLGTFMLGALGVAAKEAAIRELFAFVLEENHAMRAVFSKAGCDSSYDEPGVLRITVEPARAAGLLERPVADTIGSAVHDVVTAASLALA